MTATLFERLEGAAVGAALPLTDVLDALAFDADGLIPAIARDHASGSVLMMAWNTASQPGRPEGGEAMALRAVYAHLVERFPNRA